MSFIKFLRVFISEISLVKSLEMMFDSNEYLDIFSSKLFFLS